MAQLSIEQTTTERNQVKKHKHKGQLNSQSGNVKLHCEGKEGATNYEVIQGDGGKKCKKAKKRVKQENTVIGDTTAGKRLRNEQEKRIEKTENMEETDTCTKRKHKKRKSKTKDRKKQKSTAAVEMASVNDTKGTEDSTEANKSIDLQRSTDGNSCLLECLSVEEAQERDKEKIREKKRQKRKLKKQLQEQAKEKEKARRGKFEWH